jgi:hypothetical protein
MTVTVTQGLWKEGSKKKYILWKCLWPQGCERKAARKKYYYEGACGHFWALRLTSTKYFSHQVQLITFFNAAHKSKTGTANMWGTT